jgi:hypothetical protein
MSRMKSEVYERKVDTRDQLLARILDEKHAIFAHELQSALSLTGGFLNICHLNTKLKLKLNEP